jgi:hypothetical protein
LAEGGFRETKAFGFRGKYGFCKMLGNCYVATQLVASRVVLSSIELES